MTKTIVIFLAIVLPSWATSSQAALIQEIWQSGAGGIQLGHIEFNIADGDCTGNFQCNDTGRAAGHIVDFSFTDPGTGVAFSDASTIPGTIDWLIDDTTWALTVQNSWVFTQFAVPPQGGTPILYNLTISPTFYSVAPGQGDLPLEFRPVEDPATGAPEPATLALFSLGLAGLGFSRRRKV